MIIYYNFCKILGKFYRVITIVDYSLRNKNNLANQRVEIDRVITIGEMELEVDARARLRRHLYFMGSLHK